MSDIETRTTRADKWGRNAHRYNGLNCHDALHRRRMERWCGAFEKPIHITRQQPIQPEDNELYIVGWFGYDHWSDLRAFDSIHNGDWEKHAIDPTPHLHIVREVDNTPEREEYQSSPYHYEYDDEERDINAGRYHEDDEPSRITYWRWTPPQAVATLHA